MGKPISYVCPNCNAPLRWAGERECGFCESCGNKVFIEGGKIRIEISKEVTTRIVNDARIKEAEVKEKVKLAKIENERRGDRAAWIIGLIAFLFLILVGFVLPQYMINSEKREKQQIIEQEQQYIEQGKVKMSSSAKDYKKQNYSSALASLEGLGFTDIEVIPIYDVTFKSSYRYNKVESISIAGNYDFNRDDFFSKTDKVVITYHTKEE